MLIVIRINFDKYGIIAGRIVAFRYFGDFIQLFDNGLEHAGFFQKNSHKSAGMIPHNFRVEDKFGTFYDAQPGQPLHTLMDGRPRYAALARDLKKRYARVGADHRQYFPV